MIPSSFIQDLLARTDIADIVGRHVTLKKAGINYKGLCPFHGEKSPSFIVSPSRQTYHCFGCGVHGNAIGFLMENSGLNFVEAVRDLAQINGMPVPEDKASPQDRELAKAQKEKQVSLTDVMAKATKHWRAQLKASPRAVAYLKGRGLTGEVAARFALGYAPEGWKGLASVFPDYDDPLLVESGLVIVPEDGLATPDQPARRYDRFRDRIMFPIRSVQGDIIGFGGRVLDKGEPKYLNSPETPVFSKGRELYGLFEARTALRNKGYVIVTEGYMDVVALAQWGYGNAVATLGTACTTEHAHKLFRFTEQVVFSFDGDAAGRRAAGRALEASLPHATDTRRISFLFLPAEHDPDSYIREFGAAAFEECVAKAVPLSRQLLTHSAHDCDLDSAEGRTKLLAQALPLLAQLPEGALRGQIADELATQARCPVEDVRQRLARQGQSGPGHRSGGGGGSSGGGSGGGSYQGAPDGEPPFDPSAYDSGGYGPDDGSPGGYDDQPRQYRRGGREGKSGGNNWSPRQKGRWRRDGGGGWERQGRPDRPLPQAARPLERAAWLLLHRSDLWEQLPPDAHDLLCDQPMPLGALFSWLDRTVADEGPLSHAELTRRLQGSPDEQGAVADEGLRDLMQRITRLDEMLPKKEDGDAPEPVSPVQAETMAGLLSLIQPLQLQALNDELELLLQSGELSEQAELRKYDLLRQTNALKLEITRQRPISR